MLPPRTGTGFVVVLAAAVGACAPVGGERSDGSSATTQAFESAEARLVDFDIDGRLVADTSDTAALMTLAEAQLMYAVGQLNGERSVGWYERLEVTALAATPLSTGRFDVRYRAKLPVAWGAPSPPATYTLVLPAAVSPAEQVSFTTKYGTTCVDPESGDLNAGGAPEAGRMFLAYRPQRAGCTLADEDVVELPAKIAPSVENSIGKYPEYHRIWEDNALDLVAIFGVEAQETAKDAGTKAFDDFVREADSFLAGVQPAAAKRATTRTLLDGRRRARLEATLADGRVVRVDTVLVGTKIADERASFDAWYDAASNAADLIVYNGHAAHGANVHALMTKGTFAPRKYVVWVANGCDTLAYVDRTLADRRAVLNPDDPGGTKYMDTVTNVLGAWFRTNDETTMRFLRDVVAATGPNASPKTYRQIFSGIDRDQIVVVTGEEDNEFPPRPQPAAVSSPAEGSDAPAPTPADPKQAVPSAASDMDRDRGCSEGGVRGQSDATLAIAAAIALVLARRRSWNASS